MIAVRDLSVSFGDVSVLAGVDATIDRGTFVGVVGPNGAGKTTLLRAITGVLNPDAGEVRVAGDPASGLSAREMGRRIASVPQETSLSFDFPVRNVVEMGRTPHLGRFDGHGADDAAAVREAMAVTDVERFADRPITEVSGGERGRVLLARALAQSTPALLLDEPTASLDVNHAVRTLELVRGLVDDGKTAVAAIHDLGMAARYCDELVLIAGGRVHAAGPPDDVLDAETLRETFDAAAFVGRDPATGAPAVTPFPRRDVNPRRVHVVGTGRGAGRVLARLSAAGHDLSVGVVPETDAVAGVAADAGATAVTSPPFEAPDPDTTARARRLSAAADVTVVVGTVAGPNRPVRDAAGTPVVVDPDVDPDDLLAAVADAGDG
ncbi:ATP-binding cassette domain-containing protein [Halorubrum sp. JWXQ-INN 858]|nr:ATP-binding cassette domain-containing protein [Halorubrum sp. JWXQ-INN 858]